MTVCGQVPVITSASFMRLSSVTESSPRFSASSISTMATRGGAAEELGSQRAPAVAAERALLAPGKSLHQLVCVGMFRTVLEP